MTDSFFHGIQIEEPTDGVRPIRAGSTTVIGLLAIAGAAVGDPTNALNAAFPVGARTLVSDVRSAIAHAGTTGTLAPALRAIAEQGSPVIVVVRVAQGNDAAATEANLVAGAALLLGAEGQFGVRPTILGAPGHDTQDVVNALVETAQKLRGFVYAACRPDGDVAAAAADAATYREEFSARELMLIWPETTGWDGHAVSIALGLRSALDEQVGWHKSISNVAVNGVTGISKDVHFDIRDSSTDAGILNAADITTIVRMNGYRFWGNHTTSDDDFFMFETATRTAQAIQDGLARIEAPFIDQPMTAGRVRDIEENGNAYLRRLIPDRIVGGKCWYDAASNPGAALAAGRLSVDIDYTPAAPIEGLTIRMHITSQYYDTLGDQIANAVTA